MHMTKFATFFGGAQNDTESKEYKDSVRIGEILHDKGYHVKNGGYRGLMEAVSKGAKEKGGTVLGYTCKTFGSTKGNKFLSMNIECKDIFARLDGLITSDLFVVEKGGIGTISELFLTLDIIRKMDKKPPVFLIGEHWESIMSPVKDFMNKKEHDIYEIIKDVEQLKNKI